MKYLLDTNTCIRYLNRRSASIIHRMDAESPDDIVVCSVTRAELIFGVMKSNNPEKTRAKQREFLEPLPTLPFDDAAAEDYGRIRAQLEAAGTPIGPNDLLIAAIALTHDLIVITHNTREFSRINGLKIEDWEVD
ncbi:MAG: type II toxin-antitoxin system VapC family toxin [Anaerolineae bacterium]|nr:type II toxin-antitoxin system VapC family toxin [Anaerolineae bacterium]